MSMSITPPSNIYIANSNKALSQRQGLNFLGRDFQRLVGILSQNSVRTRPTPKATEAFVDSSIKLLNALKSRQDGHTGQLRTGDATYSINQNGVHLLDIFNSDNQRVQEITLNANEPDGVLGPLNNLLTSLQPKT
jgi:hypothetical protein